LSRRSITQSASLSAARIFFTLREYSSFSLDRIQSFTSRLPFHVQLVNLGAANVFVSAACPPALVGERNGGRWGVDMRVEGGGMLSAAL
jgi:hypothetical protein